MQLTRLIPGFFEYTIDEVGGDTLEAPGAEDFYAFSVPVGGLRLYVDWQGCAHNMRAEILDSSGTPVPTAYLGHCNERFVTLPEGDYTFRVWFQEMSTVGPYGFKVWSVPDPQGLFPYTIDDVISDGVPAAGAGRLEQIGSEDHYSFSVPAGGSNLYYQWLSCVTNIRAQILDAGGNPMPTPYLGHCNTESVTLPEGDYTLRVWSQEMVAVGPYSFEIISTGGSPVDVIELGLGHLSAGAIEAPGKQDHLVFSLGEDSSIFVDVVAVFYDFRYRLVNASTGAQLIAPRYQDSSVVQLPAGDYRLEVYGLGTANGNYSLVINATS